VVGLDNASRNVTYPDGTQAYVATTAFPSPTSWAVTTVVMDADSMSVYINGELRETRAGSLVQPEGMALGGYLGALTATNASRVDVGEVRGGQVAGVVGWAGWVQVVCVG
jgi:hypothetical protein